jgi:hypothetical protein
VIVAPGQRWQEALERALLALWVGGLWAVGLLAAPALFQMLDSRSLAGDVAGHLFSRIHLFGLVAAAVLVFLALARDGARWLRGWRAWILLAMIAVTAAFELALSPAIAELRADAATRIAGSAAHARFRVLHGTASAAYLLNCLLGLVMVVAGLAGRRA